MFHENEYTGEHKSNSQNATPLNYFEERTQFLTLSNEVGNITLSVPFYFTRLGNMVSVSILNDIIMQNPVTSVINSTTTIPERFLQPTTNNPYSRVNVISVRETLTAPGVAYLWVIDHFNRRFTFREAATDPGRFTPAGATVFVRINKTTISYPNIIL